MNSISFELIQHLIQYLPNETEINQFRHLSTNKEELLPADRLIYEIIQIPFYVERLNVMKFQLNFSDSCNSLNNRIGLVEQACQYLYQSKHIQTLLEVILSVVNHLQSTPTHRTLTLEELSKIHDLKASKTTHTSIMTIVSQVCNDRHPEVFELKDKYQLIFSASKVELTTVKSELDELKKQTEQIQSWISKFDENESLENFLSTSRETLEKLFVLYQTVDDQFQKTVLYFTKQTTTSGSFFSIFANLISSLQSQTNKN